MPEQDWQSLNHRTLMAAIASIYHRLQACAVKQEGQTPADIAAPLSTADKNIDQKTSVTTALEKLSEIFQLSQFEQTILLLCAGGEIHPGWGVLCGAAKGSPRQPFPTFELAQIIVDTPHWSAFSALSPLRRWQMVEVGAGTALLSSPLRIDERILQYLMGMAGLDTRLSRWVRPVSAQAALAPSHQAVCDRITKLWSQARRQKYFQTYPIIQLWGPDRSAQIAIAAAACQQLDFTAYQLDLQRIPAADSDQLLALWQRESQLAPVTLIVETTSDEPAHKQQLAHWLTSLANPVIILSQSAQTVASSSAIKYEVSSPTRTEQHQLWQQALTPEVSLAETLLSPITAQFSLSTPQIQTAAAQALNDSTHDRETLSTTLWAACRAQTRPRLDDLAQRLVPKEGWEDLVLPAAQRQTLEEMVGCLRSQHRVYQEWGFAQKQSQGLGISALFSGISGTGKTMAAGVIASTLQLDLYRIDLSSVVSKYIGETEKNLRQVFDAAEAGSVVLLFDEADALFGKRSQVRDSHDRYANMEVSYLLQRMEAYKGLAILTTNLKESIDPAFMRRLKFIVKFTAPDFDQRLAIWQRIFPTQTPTEDLNYRKLARLNVTGGLIRNIALTAAFMAAEQVQSVSMSHLLQATQREYSKLERPVPATEVKGWIE